jgi:hypothetical protein
MAPSQLSLAAESGAEWYNEGVALGLACSDPFGAKTCASGLYLGGGPLFAHEAQALGDHLVRTWEQIAPDAGGRG